MSTYAVSTNSPKGAALPADNGANELAALAALTTNGAAAAAAAAAATMMEDDLTTSEDTAAGAPTAPATADPARLVKLTKREIEVLTLVIEGNSSKQVADHLYVSKRTVDFHLANIYHKLGVTNRVQAFREATRRGLIPFSIVGSARQ